MSPAPTAPGRPRSPARRAVSGMPSASLVCLLVAGACLTATPGAAQTVADVRSTCTSAGGGSAACSAAAVSARALAGHVTLAGGLGSEVSGTASNLGQRLGASPRLTFGARAGLVRVGLADLRDPSGLAEASATLSTLHVDAAAGLFDGFRIMPTVGGFLALDLFGRAGIVLLPTDLGFDGRGAVFTLGARVGLVRESFSLPGVSVSMSRRFAGVAALGQPGDDPARILVDPSVTSIRATIGKDLFAVEWMAGMGWEDVSADVDFTVSNGSSSASGSGTLGETRRLYFVGGSMTMSIVLSLSVEAGLADGFAPVPAYTGAFDPTGGSFFVSAAARLII